MVDEIVLYVELDGQIWMVMADGNWLPLTDVNLIDLNLPLITNIDQIIEMQNSGEFSFVYNNQTFVVDQQAIQHGVTPSYQKNNQYQQDNPTISSGGGLGATTRLQVDGDEVLADAGYQSRNFTTETVFIEQANNELIGKLRNEVQLTISIDDGSDTTLNQYEVSSPTIYGTSEQLENGRIVVITVTDSQGEQLTFTTLIDNNSWSLGEVDLSSLNEGPIVLTAVVTDRYGNFVDALTDSAIDTIASIEEHFEAAAGDNVINQFEVVNEILSGTVTGVEDGQQVTVIISDNTGYSETFVTTTIESAWSLGEQNLSAFSDGLLTSLATVTDVAGNESAVSASVIKDTKSEITLQVNSGDDNTINKLESVNTGISGGVGFVEDGQLVSILITDVNNYSETFSATVIDGNWSVGEQDLSAFSDGLLTVTASVEDLAGNPAVNSTNIVKDVIASITINIDSGADDVINSLESETTLISGQVTNVEDGQPVSISIADSAGNTLTFTTLVSASSWQLVADISSINDGELTVVASVTDVAGNPASSETSTIKDSLASLNIHFENEAEDNVINQFEVDNEKLFGSVSNIEDGQLIKVVVTDNNGYSETYSTTINAGEWTLDNNDLSAFSEGQLVAVASATDIAGNLASSTTTITKDTFAQITLALESGEDGWLNADEIQHASLSGTVSGVEDGQIVQITASDSSGVIKTISAEIVDGKYALSGIDLTGVANGTLSVTAVVADQAGNPASTANSVQVDTLARIFTFINSNGDNYLNASEVATSNIWGNTIKVDDGEAVTLTVTDVNGDSLVFTTTTNNSLYSITEDLSSLAEGLLTVTAEVTDNVGNQATASDTAIKDTIATITFKIDDGGDGWLNATEILSASAYGDSTGIEDGQIVTIVATDNAGNSAQTTTTVTGGIFSVSGIDLSAFSDGIFTATASVLDVAGNPAVATDDVLIDTLASLSLNIESNGDGVLNAVEVPVTKISGHASDVNDGAVVVITVTDASGKDLTFSAVVSGNEYVIENADLSNLDEGLLTAQAVVTDVHGNDANAFASIKKDTIAELTLTIEDGGDGWLNGNEITAVSGFGTVTNIEDGNTVTITATDSDSNVGTVTAVVIGGQYTVTGLDLSHFVDGQFTVVATVSDNAGNPATVQDTTIIDTLAEISIVVETNGDNILNASEVANTSIHGNTAGIKNSQTVTVSITDSAGKTLVLTTSVLANQYVINSADLSSLAEGSLTAVATVTDIPGNSATASTDVMKDTLASLTIEVDSGSDNVLNETEITATHIFGDSLNIEDKQTVTVLVSDGVTTLTFSTDISAGKWSINSADLSSLNEGNLTFTATAVDIAGNPASDTTDVNKDTLADVTINFEQQMSDSVLNSIESDNENLFGSVTNIENGQFVTVTVADSLGSVLTFNTQVIASHWLIAKSDLSSLSDGLLTAQVTVLDQAGNNASASTTIIKDTGATISVVIESGGDAYINNNEVSAVTIHGAVIGVENGQTVTLTITDINGNSLAPITATVAGGLWSIDNIDLSSLDEGEFSAVAQVADQAGNSATGSDSAIKDVLAETLITIDDHGDGFLNSVEISNVTLSGTVTYIEDGQVVFVSVTDGVKTESGTATIVAGKWQADGLDLSAFDEGTLTATATITDVAGNVATATDSVIKDTQANLTVSIESGGDHILNATELNPVTVFGNVTDVEDNQIVSFTVTDGSTSSGPFTATVIGGVWEKTGIDFSIFNEGNVTVNATVSDVSGNPYTADALVIKDTLASITVDIKTDADVNDNVINAAESLITEISGTTSNIEDGQLVTVVVIDGAGNSLSFSTTVTANSWSLPSVDLSSLVDGSNNITATATIEDIAGNPATANDTASKDTLAGISVEIDSGSDNILNSAEMGAVTINGTVTNIEENQTVNITISDQSGNQINTTATVSSSAFQLTGIDLSGLDDGLIEVLAEVSDIAGNPATTTDDAIKDTELTIDIDTDSNNGFASYPGFNSFYFITGLHTEIAGSTTAEAGQVVTVTISDGTTSLDFNAVVDNSGRWLAENIDIDSLDETVVWSLQATVDDVAGNSVWDEMPDLNIITPIVFSEDNLGSKAVSASTQLEINNVNTELSFTPNQPQLDLITSEGQSISSVLAGDGLSIEVRRDGDGQLVLSAVLDPVSGTVSVTMFEALDHALDSDKLITELFVKALQTDADGTTESSVMPVIFLVNDSTPIANEDRYIVTEDQTSSANLLVNDTAVDGDPLVNSVTYDGLKQMVTAGSDAVFNTNKGLLTVQLDGSWTFVAAHNLDNTQQQFIDFSYEIIDFDGDISSAPAKISIVDGDAGQMNNASGSFHEATVNISTDHKQTFTINAGSDDLVASSIKFTDAMLSYLDGLGLQSNGETITFTFNGDQTAVIATANAAQVFTISLSAINTGANLTATTTFTQTQPLDHISSDKLNIDFSVSATDSDGTEINTGVFNWVVNDGDNAAISNDTQATLSEADLITGNVTDQGTLTVTPGSDNTASIAFDITKQPALTAGGEVIQYKLQGDVLVAFTGNSPELKIFSVQLTGSLAEQSVSSLGYSVTLYEAIDQLDASGEHVNSLAIAIVVSVIDGDNDISEQNLIINITDSGESIIVAPDMHVTEIPKAPTTPGIFTDTDSTLINITADLDPIVDIAIDVKTNDAVLLSDGSALTQSGHAVTWQVNSNGEYKGVLADGSVVFVAKLPASIDIAAGTSADVSLNFTLLAPVDHDINIFNNKLDIILPIVVKDSDKSAVFHDINVTIDDGKNPSLTVSGELNLDENVLINENDSDKTNYQINTGSDQVVAVQPILAGQEIPGLTSGGLAVSFSNNANSNGWWLAKNSDGDLVFKIKFNLNGTINSQLVGPIDHPDDSTADILSLNIAIEAIDADGDTSGGADQVTINFQDDVPESSSTIHILEEGQTETFALLANNEAGADGGSITNIHLEGTDYAPGTLIELFTADDGTKYGTIVINSDGTGELITDSGVFHVGLAIFDLVKYTITDGDGDTTLNNLILDIADEPGEITINDTSTLEDTPLTLSLIVSVGDKDNNEAVDQVIFKQSSLLGGTLTFNGNPLATNGDGDFILNSGDLTDGPAGGYVPNGPLIYIPLLNSSNQTQTVILDIDAIISRDNGVGGRPTETVNNNIELSIESDADIPTWDNGNSTFVYDINEDAAEQGVSIQAALFDTDSSETLSYQIGNIDSGLTLTVNSVQLSTGDSLTAAEVALIKGQADAGLAGILTFNITPIATEAENSDQQAGAEQTVTFNVTPVADTPDLVVANMKGLEDEILLLNEVLNGQLTDNDGSESLSYQITVPSGWSVVAISGSSAVVTDLGAGVYQVEGSDVDAGEVGLLPKLHVSSETGTFFIQAQAIATESTQDGLDATPTTASSTIETFQVFLKGVVDAPTVTAGGDWGVDPDDSQKIINTATMYEDQLIALNIAISTPDQDGSESINLLLSNLPDGFLVTDSVGDEVSLSISHFDVVTGKPVYQVTLADLQNLYLKPLSDFSGQVSFNIDTIITESDGDTKPDGVSGSLPDDGLFSLVVEIDITPVIDSNASNANLDATGQEDQFIPIYLLPDTSSDIDGSETVTAFTVDALPTGMSLYFDAVEIAVPVDLNTLIDATSPSLEALLNSGRFTVQPPTDASGTFTVDVSYEVTDTSETGEMVTSATAITASLTVVVNAQVEDLTSPDNNDIADITRLEAVAAVQVSDDASPISLAGLVQFYDQDNDGSEYIDYIVIQVPKGDNWLVTHDTNEVIHDGDGRWLIDASGLTSNSVMENGSDILAGASIYTYDATLFPSQIAISAHVIDGDDKEMINTSLQVHFKDNGTNSNASDISDLQINPIIGDEDNNIDIGSQINTSVAGDGNDILSFKVLANDLPHGGTISGSGVIVDYDTSGKVVVQYLFTEDSLSSLSLNNISEDFAGTFDVPITAIATDGVSGDTLTEIQTLQFEIAPIVDGASLVENVPEILEDTLTPLKLSVVFADSNITDQGIESLTGLILDLVDGGTLVAADGLLTDLGSDRWQVNDLTRIDEIAYQGPLHVSGQVSIKVEVAIIDTANGYSGTLTDTGNATHTITLDITPVTDSANITSNTSRGDEDTYIALTGLDVQFIDNDGSETMSIEIAGVPTGAVLVVDNGFGSYTVLPNNGVDGGTFDGQPTYKWSVDESQFANLAIRPPLDFSGDIPMSIKVIGYEKGTTDYVTTEGDFVLEVLPIADPSEITTIPGDYIGVEGQVTVIDLAGRSTETFSDETLLLSVKIEATSDASAFLALDRIRVGSVEGVFVITGPYAIATLEVNASEMDSFELLTGPYAFGHMDLEVGIITKDSAIVGGVLETDFEDNPTLFNISVDLTPEVDVPDLTLNADSIFAVVGSEAPLGVELALINPATGETGYVEISGVPAGVTISNATESSGIWTIQQSDLGTAKLEGLDSEQVFDLTIVPGGELAGDSITGTGQTLTVNIITDTNVIDANNDNNIIVAGAGDDLITGGAGNDQFVFNSADQASPANDTITDFTVGSDSLNLTDLFSSVNASTGGELDVLIDLLENSGDTTVAVKVDGSNIVQNIVLNSTTVDDLYGSDASGISESDILTKLLDDQTLITGQV